MMRARPKLSDDQLRRRVAQFQPMFERYCPHLLEEMRGLAEGAGVTFEEAMLCSIRGKLSSARAEVSPRMPSDAAALQGTRSSPAKMPTWGRR
jgi:hypothetical protein